MTSILHMLHRITTSSFVDHNFDILEANHGKTLGTSYALHIENMDLALLWIFASWSIHLQCLQQVESKWTIYPKTSSHTRCSTLVKPYAIGEVLFVDLSHRELHILPSVWWWIGRSNHQWVDNRSSRYTERIDPPWSAKNERVMIERREKEDIETQIYKDILIMNDDDGKMRERRSLNPNLQRYIDNTSTTLHELERKNTKK